MDAMDVTFELVTGAFAGAAVPRRTQAAREGETDGLRIPELKPLLRFWWRTLHGLDDNKTLFKKEAEVFGSTDGQRFRIMPQSRVMPSPGQITQVGTSSKNHLYDNDTLTYMGYGPVTWNNEQGHKQSEFNTAFVHEGVELRTRCMWHREKGGNEDEAVQHSRTGVVRALWLLSAFGGYGGRSRRGWGSIRVKGPTLSSEWDGLNLSDPHGYETRKGLVKGLGEDLRRLLSSRVAGAAIASLRHTGFSASTVILVGPGFPKAAKAMERARQDFAEYRRALGAWHYHDRLAAGSVGPDHKLRYGWVYSTPPANDSAAPLGSAFGLPHNGQFRKPDVDRWGRPNRVPGGPTFEVGLGDALTGRRASPLFFKVIRCGREFVPIALYLPAPFVPDPSVPGNPAVNFRQRDRRTPVNGPIPLTPPLFDAIDELIQPFTVLTCYAKDGGTSTWQGLIQRGWDPA